MLNKILLPLFAAFTLMAAQSVFEFEKADALASWSVRTPGQDVVEISEKYVSFGERGLRFATPAYQEGMSEWPCLDGIPDVKDWRGYERLVLDIVNVGASRNACSVYVTDSKIPFANCLLGNFSLSGEFEIQRIVLPLSEMRAEVDWADVSLVHISSNTSPKDAEIYFSGIYLLKPGEKLPAYPKGFLDDVHNYVSPLVDKVYNELESAARRFAEENAELEPKYQKLLGEARRQCDEISGIVSNYASAIPQVCEQLKKIRSVRDKFSRQFHKVKYEYAVKGSKIVVGVASSMERVMPKDHPFDSEIRKNISVSLARHEWQSFQLAVKGHNRDLKNVTVISSDLHTEDGLIFPASHIECQTVGYVLTKNKAPYNPEYIGWWPDPILNFQHTCDIAKDDTQAFWIRVYSDKRQQPGLYTGALTVQADGVDPVILNLTVNVWDFILPDQAPLPTAIHTAPPEIAGAETAKWQKMKYVYVDFLADYHIDYDQIYRWAPPDWDVVNYLHEQGRLTSFCLGCCFVGGIKKDKDESGKFEREFEKFINHMRPTYEKTRELGLIDYAYIYGFDECPPEDFEYIERVAKRLHEEFPGVKFMTTSFDVSCGEDTIAKSVDAWCPLTSGYKLDKVRKAQAKGTLVWWYICCGPLNPYCNWFMEYSPIETRLLMGAMTAKYRPDGFLYYFTDWWKENKGIGEGPYTTWDPVSYSTYHGDGSIFYCDPNGNPLPSIRLENFRDGMQDFAYVRILEDLIRQVEGDNALAAEKADWLARAKAILVVPDDVVKGLTVYTHDPNALRKWRDALGDAIEASGLSHDYRWKFQPGLGGTRGRHD